MLEFEQRNVPTVAFIAEGFTGDASHSAATFGLPALPFATVPLPFTNQPADAIQDMVDAAEDQVLRGLTAPVSPSEEDGDGHGQAEEWLEFTGPDMLGAVDAMYRRLLELGWTDGFPMVPPTEPRVARMLEGVRRDPDDIVAVLEPGFGMATVRKIAINAVMAGCRPEHLPILVAAVECLAEPRMYLRNKAMSTGPHAPLMWVNGPIRQRVGLNGGRCALGPGAVSYVNSVVGRALRLCMMNLGHTYPGVSDLDTLGSPTKYGMCVAENQESSPWDPYHVEQGFEPDADTVTVQFVYGICELQDFQSTSPDALAEVFGTALNNAAQVSSGLWLVGRRADPRYGTEEKEHHVLFVCPEHAQLFQRGGWGRSEVRRALHKHGRMPFRTLMLPQERRGMEAAHPELLWLWDSPETMVPVLEDDSCYDIVVVGGPAGRSALFYGAGQPVTRAIQG